MWSPKFHPLLNSPKKIISFSSMLRLIAYHCNQTGGKKNDILKIELKSCKVLKDVASGLWSWLPVSLEMITSAFYSFLSLRVELTNSHSFFRSPRGERHVDLLSGEVPSSWLYCNQKVSPGKIRGDPYWIIASILNVCLSISLFILQMSI